MTLGSKALLLFNSSKTILTRPFGQRAVGMAALCSVLAACGGPAKPVGVLGHVDGFAGMIAADEPRAAMVGRDVLSSGGSPADAMVAMAWTMAVTYPSDVSLGAGGSCLVYDRQKNEVEALTFISGSRSGASAAENPASIPALARGLYALHSRYGRLRWEQLMGPADGMARIGFPASRAFVQKLDPEAHRLYRDAGMRSAFFRGDGRSVQEGDVVTQYALGGVLSRIRSKGVGDFYSGSWARTIVSGFNGAGGGMDAQSLDSFAPGWSKPISVPYGNEVAYFAPLPAAAGLLEAQYWALLAGNPDYARAETRTAIMARIFANGMGDRESWMNADGTSRKTMEYLLDPGHLANVAEGRLDAPPPVFGRGARAGSAIEPSAGSGLVVVDQDGNAVTCAISLNAPFGTGRMATGTGIVMGAAPGYDGAGPMAIGPMMATNPKSGEFRFAAAGGGDSSVAAAMVSVALESLVNGTALSQAMAEGRLYAPPGSRAILVEPDFADKARVASMGREVRQGALSARLNAARCVSGTPGRERCQVATDPRGYGLGIMVGGE